MASESVSKFLKELKRIPLDAPRKKFAEIEKYSESVQSVFLKTFLLRCNQTTLLSMQEYQGLVGSMRDYLNWVLSEHDKNYRIHKTYEDEFNRMKQVGLDKILDNSVSYSEKEEIVSTAKEYRDIVLKRFHSYRGLNQVRLETTLESFHEFSFLLFNDIYSRTYDNMALISTKELMIKALVKMFGLEIIMELKDLIDHHPSRKRMIAISNGDKTIASLEKYLDSVETWIGYSAFFQDQMRKEMDESN